MKGRPSPDEFEKWRSPKRGSRNPDEMTNAFWVWCVHTGESAYTINRAYGGPDSMTAGPCWCFDRFGQTHLQLPDGRDVYVGGEHEDHYDPDFYIYNDVVIAGDDEIKILGYPETDFPPTDFQSANLVGDTIWLVGNLGYPEDRAIGRTQVLTLDINNWKISQVETTGSLPGWIHGHEARYAKDDHAIVITGGKRCEDRIIENIDDYQLSLSDLSWKRLTARQWPRWILEREDGEANSLWAIRSEALMRDMGQSLRDGLRKTLSNLPDEFIEELTPRVSDEQIQQIRTIYQFPPTGEIASEDTEQHGRYRLEVDGTTVRFDEEAFGIVVTVEGQLAKQKIDPILARLQQSLSSLEQTNYKLTHLD